MTVDRTILIIDDSATDREAYRRFLSKSATDRYQFLEADCAESALPYLQEATCDLVLLDFCLPGSSGLELLEDLKQLRPNFAVPIIMLTGQGDEHIAVEAMKWGVQDYLSKHHLQADILQLAVRNVLQKTLLKAQLSHIRERQRLIATTALRIRQSLNLDEILNTAVAEVQQILCCEQVAIYELDPDAIDTQPHPHCELVNLSQTITSTCDWHSLDQDMVGKIRAISMLHDWGMAEESKPQSNLIAEIALADPNGESSRIWGVLVAHQHQYQRQWQSEEQEILQEVAVQLAIAIQQAELLQQTQVALEREKELNQFRSQIIATVSHEYRTPLTAIWAAASTLKLHGEKLGADRQARCLEIIEQKSRRLKQLVEDMLAMQECEANKMLFQPTAMDLVAFITEIVADQQEMAGGEYTLDLHIRGSCKGFRGDPSLLRLVCSNLLANAVKYTPNGGRISISLTSSRSTITLGIEDAGIGIPLAEQSKLFQQFQRGSNVGTIPGMGLGLAIARLCTERHGGTIELSSQPKKGTKVLVTLPKKAEITEEQTSSHLMMPLIRESDSLVS
jgi:signal transduction histidine kinase/DNA-binding NarL/FixJ family response regulator